ncbi:MAG: GNAT family N-acetyltransferase [Armatimonadetes bacterium]|nr:GNAT family N-acetyltransferase [Armatimonadota bacterium]
MTAFRPYDPGTDREAVRRIFQEVGWSHAARHVDDERFGQVVRVRVAEHDGAAECVVTTCAGTIRHLETDLPFACVLEVATSRVARRQGLALRLLSRTLSEEAAEGALVAGLGVFDQGFYDRAGFGTAPYARWVEFNPGDLAVDGKPRAPRRLSRDDGSALHAARLTRRRCHGACNLTPPAVTQADLGEPDTGFGLGYFDGPDGAFSHGLWLRGKDEHGPYNVAWSVYHTREEFLELMALLKGLADQVHLVGMHEPSGVQLQDLLTRPLAAARITEGSRYASRIGAGAYFQFRILDVPGCLGHTHLPGTGQLRFNLNLADPVEAYLPGNPAWSGCQGRYVVELGESCSGEPGEDTRLPTLNATVNAFTRLWLGVQPATGLAFTDELAGPDALLAALDCVLRLPQPEADWGF